MAGFLDNSSNIGKIRKRLIEISRFGMKFDDLMIKNSQSIGFIEGELKKRSGSAGLVGDDLLRYSMAISDTTSQLKGKTLAFFQLDYAVKREKLRDVASNSEIEFVLDNIADDTIVFDDHNMFCTPTDIRGKIKGPRGIVSKEGELNYKDEIVQLYFDNFSKIYSAWGFDVGISAWQYLYQFLIEGHLAFEILYDSIDKPKEIIGFKEMDPALLFPIVQKDHQGKIYLEWLEKDETTNRHRTLTDAQVIYISYSNFFKTKRVSFVERMLRSFNLLRIMEHSKVTWTVMNAPTRLKTKVPMGTKSLQKSMEDLNTFANIFKEDIYFNNDTGELKVDGQPRILFYKNYVIPMTDGANGNVEIEPLTTEGPNLQEDQLLNYFMKKLKMDSKLPFSRWDYAEGGGVFNIGVEQVNREEITYNKFIMRLRSIFQEIIIKPWYIQMCLDNDSLKDDINFKNAIGVTYTKENEFLKMKEQAINKSGMETIKGLMEIKKEDGSNYFSTDMLVKKYLGFSELDLKANEDALANVNKKPKEGKAEATGGAEAAGGAETGLESEGEASEAEETGTPLE